MRTSFKFAHQNQSSRSVEEAQGGWNLSPSRFVCESPGSAGFTAFPSISVKKAEQKRLTTMFTMSKENTVFPSSSSAPSGSSQTARSVSSRQVPVGMSEQQMLQTAIEASMGGKAAATAAAAAQAKGGGEVRVIDDSEDEASSKDAASKAQTSAPGATVHNAHLALEASGRLVSAKRLVEANNVGGASREAEGPSSVLSGEGNAGKGKLSTGEAQRDPAQEQEAVSRRQEEKAAAAAANEEEAKIKEEEARQLANAPRQAGAPWCAKALLRFEQGEQGPVPDMPNTFELDSSQKYVIGRQASRRFSKELCILTFT